MTGQTQTLSFEAPAATGGKATTKKTPTVDEFAAQVAKHLPAQHVDMTELGQQLGAALCRHLTQPAPGVFDSPDPAYTSPYVFDAARGRFYGGEYDFSTDLFAVKDKDAQDRALSWIQHQFATTSGNVAAATPQRHRGDLAVDQRDYTHPLTELLTKKPVLTDGTPFTFPVFVSGTPLVAAHTQGVAPTDSTFVLTGKTVTPGAVSGRIQIPREVIDAGGNPQVSGWIWTRMVAAYNEMLEEKIVAALVAEAANITDVAIPAGATNTTLIDAIRQMFIGLNYAPGGHTFEAFALQQDLYKALVQAVDNDGRPLLPTIGAVNAAGTLDSRRGILDLYGVQGIPSWALGPASDTSSNSWLIDPNAVHAWASVPRKLDFDWRTEYVDMAIWGYQATVVADPAGVRQVTYDPTS